MPELSVLMPVRNGELTIASAAKSVLLGMPRDSELAVYDDGSTDDTLSVLESLSDPRIRVVRGKGGSGVAGGLNALLEATDSAFVARMDADDISLPGRFEMSRRGIERADVVFGTHAQFSWPRLRLVRPQAPVYLSPAGVPLALLIHNVLSHPTAYGRRSAFTSEGGYRTGAAAEDYDLWLRMCLGGFRLVRLPLPMLLYRIHQGQVTGQAGYDTRASSEVGETVDALAIQRLGVARTSPFFKAALVGHIDRLSSRWERRYLHRRVDLYLSEDRG